MNSATPVHIASILRYPVKGLRGEALDKVKLTAGRTLPFDRAWAIENGPSGFDPASPGFLPKTKFLALVRDERLALLDIRFDEAAKMLVILRGGKPVVSGKLDEPTGRQVLEQFFASFMEADLRGPPKILAGPGHSFSDVPDKCVSIINRASCDDLARVVGRAIDPDRFRGNFVLEGLAPWAEFDWVGRRIRLGSAQVEVFARIQRCPATNVDPRTAARDMQIPKSLMDAFGHMDCGVYARVIEDGKAEPGSPVKSIQAN
ncbi:Flavodoxin reductases (ferredoxin-NADPH reductases) family 1 [hydrothermal vent metagenome]|uniref:Flavodoxin reductases (Ferredoxin-NADPH reductases) family 1 n=1 Tax=hydrothermal vent metagenome TaxID=652676 RepID=A0A3B0T450_9ZZZZ